MQYRFIYVAGIALFSTTVLLADFQYQETTQVTGGMAASLGRFAGKRATAAATSTVAVKGNRMVHASAESAQVTDLDKETITHIDFEKKTYSVMTFEQMRRMFEDMRTKMANAPNQPAEAPKTADQPDLSFKGNVRETGQKRDVSGVRASEYILTMALSAADKQSGQTGALNMTNDMWLAPEIPGYHEIRDFEMRMAKKMGSMMGGAPPSTPEMPAMRPEMGKGMAQMAAEMAKLKGTPVLQVMRVGATADGQPLPAASEAPELSKQSQVNVGDALGHAAGGAAAGAAMGRLGGLAGLGGLGGMSRRKRQDAPQEQPAQSGAGAPGGGLLMETTTEMSGFSSTVDSAKFEVPAGFKLVESEMERRHK